MNLERYRITSESPELCRLEQFYPSLDTARELAQEYADEYSCSLEIAEWDCGQWCYVETVESNEDRRD